MIIIIITTQLQKLGKKRGVLIIVLTSWTLVGPVPGLATSEALVPEAFAAGCHFLFPLFAFPLATSHADTLANKPLDLHVEADKVFRLAGG